MGALRSLVLLADAFVLPRDPAVVLLIITALGWGLRELLNMYRAAQDRALKIAEKAAQTEEAAKQGRLNDLGLKIDRLTSEVMANLRELQSAQNQLGRDLAVLTQRMAVVETETSGLRKAKHDLGEYVQKLIGEVEALRKKPTQDE